MDAVTGDANSEDAKERVLVFEAAWKNDGHIVPGAHGQYGRPGGIAAAICGESQSN